MKKYCISFFTILFQNETAENISQPIFPGSSLTVAQSTALILGYVIRHGVSDLGLQDLLYLIDAHLPRPIHGSSYFFLEDIDTYKDEKEIQEHYYCTKCYNLLEVNTDVKKNKTANCVADLCPQKDVKFPVNKIKTETKNFFLYIPVKKQLENLLNKDEIFRKLSKDRPGGVTSGDIYKGLVQDGIIGEDDITLQWNTDGASSFKKSCASLWPIFLGINELAYMERKKNLILGGLWFGSKPNMTTFLKPFVNELIKLHDEGLTLKNGKNPRVHCLVAPVDSVARPMLQNIKQFNGLFGCSYCLHPGSKLNDEKETSGKSKGTAQSLNEKKKPEKAKGNVRVYLGDVRERRTENQHIKDTQKCLNTNIPKHGIKGPSEVMRIPVFNIIDGFPPDYLHNLLGK